MTAAPLDAASFAARLDRLGPFEANPVIAIAVSGGADSMALLLFADAWARARGGRCVALTVDHGLRAASAAEARQVAGWAAARGVEHHTLAWTGAKPTSGVQAAARTARYALMGEWCREAGVLHVLLGHHRGDQAETVALRLTRGSGTDGLAGMATIIEGAAVRWLRPLIDVPRAALEASLHAAGQDWLDDPSNLDPGYARVRARGEMSARDVAGLHAAARRLGQERAARDDATAALLGRVAAVFPEGWARIELGALRAAPASEARRALSRLVVTVGGGAYAPRGERLDRLVAAVQSGRLAAGRTLGGCRIVERRGALLIAREEAAATEEIALVPGDARQSVRWDDRFNLTLIVLTAGVRVARLGTEGWAALPRAIRHQSADRVPALVGVSLPAVRYLERVVAVPHLFYGRGATDPASVVSVSFEPRQPLAGPRFPVS